VEHADRQERRKPCGRHQAERHQGGEGGAGGQDDGERLREVGEAAAEGARDEPDRRASGEERSELLGRQPARDEERRQERRRDTEGGVHERVERDEAAQHAHRICAALAPDVSGASMFRWRRLRMRLSCDLPGEPRIPGGLAGPRPPVYRRLARPRARPEAAGAP
jgi:hypothetical protein